MPDERPLNASEILGLGDKWSSAPSRGEQLDLFGSNDEQLSLPFAPADPSRIGAAPVAASEGEFDAIALGDDQDEPEDPGSDPDAPAPLTVVPTSTTNPARPRTVAAGYDRQRKTLTVMFRDGTLYNYYEVTSLVWGNFKRARSKGRFIYTYLDQLPRGFANEGSVSEFAKSQLATLAAQVQAATGGRQHGHSASSKRGARGTYRAGNLGGTGRRRTR